VNGPDRLGELPVLDGDETSRLSADGGYWLHRDDLQCLIDLLWRSGYQVIGPTIDANAICYDRIESMSQLPEGWTEKQSPGVYRLERRGDRALFGFNLGPHSWKRYLFPPQSVVAAAERAAQGWQMQEVPDDEPPLALIGVRACELAALAVQDRTFMGGSYVDPIYRRRREQAIIIAVECTQAASTCFCTSMGTGPECDTGFDLALTELPDGFTLRAGSERGAQLTEALPLVVAEADQLRRAATARRQAVEQISRRLDTDGIRDLLMSNLEHPRWDVVGQRCLSCTNCTMVCPTCFCSSVTEVSDLAGERVERVREWDSCFNPKFQLHERWLGARRRAVALSAVVDAQTGDLDRPVRHLGLCWLWSLYHVVPGRNRSDRGGGSYSGGPVMTTSQAAESVGQVSPWVSHTARIEAITEEVPDVATYHLRLVDPRARSKLPLSAGSVQHAVSARAWVRLRSGSVRGTQPVERGTTPSAEAGLVTTALSEMVPGETLGMRGSVRHQLAFGREPWGGRMAGIGRNRLGFAQGGDLLAD
jgi:sulfhydrogenase subunit beta (sulfur reductase)